MQRGKNLTTEGSREKFSDKEGAFVWVFIAVQSANLVRLFATLWTAARQASLSFTISQGLLKALFIGAAATAAAAKSLQSCPTLCDPVDGSPQGSPVPGILQARTLEWVAISFSNAGKWKVEVKSLSRVRLLVTPWTAAHQAPPSMEFSRQEYWSGVPLPSPSLHLPRSKWQNGIRRLRDLLGLGVGDTESLDSDACVIPCGRKKKTWVGGILTPAQFKYKFGQANGETSSQGWQEEASHILLK